MRFNTIFFDFYNTLATFYPPKEKIQKLSAEKFGLNVTKEGISKGYLKADEWMSKEIAKQSIRKLTPEKKLSFFTSYESIILSEDYPSLDKNLTSKIWRNVYNYPTKFKLFDDVKNCLTQLKDEKIQIGILSNIEINSSELLESLDLNHLVDFMVTSSEVGKTKPAPEIFIKALNLGKTTPEKTVHIGDQIESDVYGAKNVGIEAILIDRQNLHTNYKESIKINKLDNLNNVLSSI
jgi:HAD superfamily hydrolase (TIGR01549 family)